MTGKFIIKLKIITVMKIYQFLGSSSVQIRFKIKGETFNDDIQNAQDVNRKALVNKTKLQLF